PRRGLRLTRDDRVKFHTQLIALRGHLVLSGGLRKPITSETGSTSGSSTGNGLYEPLSFVRSTLRRLNKNKMDRMQRDIYSSGIGDGSTRLSEYMRHYPHSYWAYSTAPLENSLLLSADTEAERAAVENFIDILRFSGLWVERSPTGSISSAIGDQSD